MSLIIGCLSQKGGTGKSTIARLIAKEYASNDWRVLIADMDTYQKTSTDWVAKRLERDLKPHIAAQPTSETSQATRLDYDLIVFDGKPHASEETVKVAKVAHLIIIPTGVSIDDLKPAVLLGYELKKKGVATDRIVYILNHTQDSQVEIAEARNYLAMAGFECLTADLPERTGYRVAQNQGRAISETLHSTLNERADRVVQEIVDLIGRRALTN